MALKNEIYVAALPIVDIDFTQHKMCVDAHLKKLKN